MNHKYLARVAILLVFAAAGCGSPLDDLETGPDTTVVTPGVQDQPMPTVSRSPSLKRESPSDTTPTAKPHQPASTEPTHMLQSPDPKPETASQPQSTRKPESQPKPTPKAEPKSESESKSESRPESNSEPEPQSRPEPPPAAKGSPLNIVIFEITGAPYSANKQYVEDSIAEACGGTQCINVVVVAAPGGPNDHNCNVATIDQPNPIFAGDTITFTLSNECGEESDELTSETP